MEDQSLTIWGHPALANRKEIKPLRNQKLGIFTPDLSPRPLQLLDPIVCNPTAAALRPSMRFK